MCGMNIPVENATVKVKRIFGPLIFRCAFVSPPKREARRHTTTTRVTQLQKQKSPSTSFIMAIKLLLRLPILILVFMLPVTGQPAATPSFSAVEIDANLEVGYGVTVADVNGDRKPDILLADKSLLVWYENPTWTKHVLAKQLTALDHVCLAARDINADGKAEVAAGAGWDPNDTTDSGSVHYLIAPLDLASEWKALALPHEPTVHRMRWVKNPAGGFDLVVVPLHGRGNQAGRGAGVRILAYRAPPDPQKNWSLELLDASLHMTHNFDAVQWDDKGGDELLIAGREGVFLLDRGNGMSRPTQLTGDERGGAGEVRLGKLPGGGRFLATVEPMHGHQLVVYTAPPARESKLWRGRVLESALNEGHALACGDLLGVGSDQIVVGWRKKNSDNKVGILLFTPTDGEGKSWKKSVIDDDTMACEDLALADLDGDGRTDVIAAGRATKNLKVYYNRRAQ